MKQFKAGLHKATEGLVILSLGMITLLVVLQVGFRFVMRNPLAWPEELSRLVFIYLVFIGGAVASRDNEHIGIDLIDGWMKPGKPLAWLSLLRHLATAVVLLVVVFGSFQILPQLKEMRLAATGLSMLWMTVPVLLGSLLMAFWTLLSGWECFKTLISPDPPDDESASKPGDWG